MKKKVSWLVSGVAMIFAVASILPCFAQSHSLADYTDFAMKHPGTASNGQVLFQDEQKLACTRCHSIDGNGGRTGPDLASIGEKFSRQDLIRSVLEPSAAIAVGYGTTVIETKAGETYQGVIKQAGDTWVALMGADGKLTRFENQDIRGQHSSPVSIMPEGLQASLSLEQFADLIAYLQSLRLNGPSGRATTMIPLATKPAEFPVFFSTNVVFRAPVWFGDIPGHPHLYLVLEHGGKSWVAEKNGTNDSKWPLVDLSSTVHFGPACGLLGLAFHPQFITNHKYYLQYQIEREGHVFTVIAQRALTPDARHDTGLSTTIMEIPMTTQDHDGGCIEFGPDHYLYIAMGDTGPQTDPQGHGQDLGVLTAKMLRIDVDHANGTQLYSIPSDNPFRNRPGARPEIWALGLREPWRFSFDRVTGDLWLGDVGQDKFEKVTIVRKGENHGWNVYEGFDHFSDKYRHDDAKYVWPIFSYTHSSVGVSITGGYVYHGQSAPKLANHYICADFQVQKVWAVTQTNRVLQSIVEIGHAPSRVSSFGQDAAGELYLVGYDSGLIYSMNLAAADLTPRPAD